MTYERVLPRDAFNEANFLKCLGQLTLIHLNYGLPKGFEIHFDGNAFDLDQTCDGELMCWNFDLYLSSFRVELTRPLNSRDPWPLYASVHGVNDYLHQVPVFNEEGQFSEEFLTKAKRFRKNHK